LALPPDTAESFAREVDENLRRDQTEQFFKKNAPLIVGAMLLFLAAIAGILYWKNQQAKQAENDVEQLSGVMDDIGAGRLGTVPQRLEAIEKDGADGPATQAALTRAVVLLQQGKTTDAIAIYKTIAEDSGAAQPYRDLATIRQTTLEFDRLKPEEVIARLEPLAKTGNPWFGSAGELTALALLKQNKKAEAGRLFAAMAADKQVPDSIRDRSVQIAGSLGVDASASIPAISRPAS
jgi:hypothetical protein